MSWRNPHLEAPPPGFNFKPLAKPSNKSRLRRTSLGVSSTSSSSAPTESPHQPDNQRDVPPSRERSTRRKRARPQFLDPSPKPTTGKRGRGRPPGTGRKQRLASLFFLLPSAHRELNTTNDPHVSEALLPRLHTPSFQSGESRSISPAKNQLEEQSILIHTSPSSCQLTGQSPIMKVEDQDAQDVKETTTIPSFIEVPITADGPLKIPVRDGACGVGNQEILNIDTPKHNVANAIENHPADARTEQVGSCSVNPSLAPILQAIINKHGDIAKECPLVSGFMRTSVLEGICKVVQELQSKELTELDNCHFYGYYSALKDAQTMKLNVKWLRERLDELRDAAKSIGATEKLINEKTQHLSHIEYLKKDLQIRKVDMERLKSEIEEQECQLALKTLQTEKLNSTIRTSAARYQHFVSKSLTEGLL